MIIIAGQIESISTRKDRKLKIAIGTQELNPNESTDVFLLNQSMCYIGLKPEPFTSNESNIIDSLKSDYDNIKSPSQRLRAILYRNYEKDSEGFKDFNIYYSHKIEKLCEHFKSKLD